MKLLLFKWLLISIISFGAGCSQQETANNTPAKPGKAASATTVADSVYHNGKIYTVNEKQPWAEAVAIKDGKFVKIGSNAEVKAVAGSNTDIIDLKGKMAMPGIVDVHVHLFATPIFNVLNLDFSNPTL